MTSPMKAGGELSRSDQERWIDWARASQWRFKSYYKYNFAFIAEGSSLSPPGDVQEPFTATVAVGGRSDDIYRYTVTAEPMTWDEVTSGGDWKLTVTAADGRFLYACLITAY